VAPPALGHSFATRLNRRFASAGLTDALRGYALPVHRRDGFRCRYCGLNGADSFANWLALSWDHLLPKGHPNRHDTNFIVKACMFCNTADNHYFGLAANRGLLFNGLTPDHLVAQRLPYVAATRRSYRSFWSENVQALRHSELPESRAD